MRMAVQTLSKGSRPSRGPAPMTHSTSLAIVDMLSANGYSCVRNLNKQWCALKQFNFTTALVVGLDDVGYQRRYCYEHWADAHTALLAWNGLHHPSGPWIKCKGGGIDLVNPAFR